MIRRTKPGLLRKMALMHRVGAHLRGVSLERKVKRTKRIREIRVDPSQRSIKNLKIDLYLPPFQMSDAQILSKLDLLILIYQID